MTDSSSEDRKGPLAEYTRYKAENSPSLMRSCPSGGSIFSRLLESLRESISFTKKPLYSPLPEADSIRLLQLHPGKPGQDIKTSLRLARLNHDLPSYEALSYVWTPDGRPDERTITCDGHVKEIPENLFHALERLRDRRKTRTIWVDNLCIQQIGNDPEKNQQVRQMDLIYRKAQRVIIWLGIDEYTEAREAFTVMCTFVNAQDGQSTSVEFSTLGERGMNHVRCIHTPPQTDSKDWVKVMALFLNEWFTRMWVLQEIALARDATVIWGPAEINWEVIADAVHFIHEQPALHRRLECYGFQGAYIMNGLRDMQCSQERSTLPFLKLLDLTRTFKVSKAKDKIFGLLGFHAKGLVPGEDSPWLSLPGYESSITEIYTSVAHQILRENNNLDVLSYASHVRQDLMDANKSKQEGEKKKNLPSWVPDWTCGFIVYPMNSFTQSDQHNAGTFRELDVEGSGDGGVLRVKGIIIDEVTDSISPLPFTDLSKSTPHLETTLEWCTEKGIAPSVLAETLTAGKDAQGTLIADEDEHLAQFCAFLKQIKSDWLSKVWPDEASRLDDLATSKGDAEIGREALWRYGCYRSPFTTKSGTLGLGPGAVTAGDLVVVLWGCQIPYVIRKRTDGAEGYRFVGECYIDGVMKGEVEERLKEEGHGHVEETFVLR